MPTLMPSRRSSTFSRSGNVSQSQGRPFSSTDGVMPSTCAKSFITHSRSPGLHGAIE